MMKFEFTHNGITYGYNESTNRYSKTENGKTRHIGKAEYTEAHDAWMNEAMARAEADDAMEEREEVMASIAEEQPTKKPARKKKVRVGGMEFSKDGACVTLTDRQVDFIRHLPDTCHWESGLDSAPWVGALCDEIGGQFENKPMTVGAMISTLREKGLLIIGLSQYSGGLEGKSHKAKYIELTEFGKHVVAQILG